MCKQDNKLKDKRLNLGKILLSASVFLVIVSSFSVPAFAISNDEIMKELKRLQQRVQKVEAKLAITEKELIDTKHELVETQHDLVDAQTDTQKNNIKFSKSTGAPKFSSDDGRSSMEINGRVFVDGAQLPKQYSKGRTKDDKVYDSQTGTEIRKAYLGVEGKFWKDWAYDLTVDFAENEVDIKDANISYKGWKNNEITMGQQKPDFGLENSQSSKYSQFMERGLTDEFSPDRDLGISWHNVQDWGAFTLGAYIPNSIDTDELGKHRADAYTYIGRITFAPVDLSSQVVHLGASGAYSDYSSKEVIDFDARPESHLSEKIVGSRDILDPDSTSRYGLEAAYSGYGFLVESEYVATSTRGIHEDGPGDRETFDYNAWYVSASYMLTGESHPYSKKKGTFGRVTPDKPLSKGGWGAWEMGLRFSSIDLNDNNYNGGEMDDITLGLNWYLENNLKVMLNYINYDADNYIDSSKYVSDQDEHIVQTRIQWDF